MTKRKKKAPPHRIGGTLTDAINKGPEAIVALESMLERLRGHNFEELGLPLEGTRVVYQVYTSYHLGQLLEAQGNVAGARDCFEQVIQLDPSSNFGEMAYLKLG
jgi:hypothetical protein